MSTNEIQPACATTEHDINKRIAERRRIIEYGVHPSLRGHMIDTETNDLRPGTTMELWLPKKGTSALDPHGVRAHVNHPKNSVNIRKNNDASFACDVMSRS